MEGDIVSLSGEAGTRAPNQVHRLKCSLQFCKSPWFYFANDHIFFIYWLCLLRLQVCSITFVECFLLSSTSQPVGISKPRTEGSKATRDNLSPILCFLNCVLWWHFNTRNLTITSKDVHGIYLIFVGKVRGRGEVQCRAFIASLGPWTNLFSTLFVCFDKSLGSKDFVTSPLGVGYKILSIWWGHISGLEKYEKLTKCVHDFQPLKHVGPQYMAMYAIYTGFTEFINYI